MKFSIILAIPVLTMALHIVAAEEGSHAILKAVHSDEVRHIMRRLNLLLFEREQTQLQLQRLRQEQVQLLVEEAETLAKTAADMPAIDSLKHLDDEQQVAFNAMAIELYNITLELKEASDANHRQAVDDAYIKLQNTCNTCHQLFRSW